MKKWRTILTYWRIWLFEWRNSKLDKGDEIKNIFISFSQINSDWYKRMYTCRFEMFLHVKVLKFLSWLENRRLETLNVNVRLYKYYIILVEMLIWVFNPQRTNRFGRTTTKMHLSANSECTECPKMNWKAKCIECIKCINLNVLGTSPHLFFLMLKNID